MYILYIATYSIYFFVFLYYMYTITNPEITDTLPLAKTFKFFMSGYNTCIK